MSGLASNDFTVSIAQLKTWRRWLGDEHCVAVKVQFPFAARCFLFIPGRTGAYTDEDPPFQWTDYTIPVDSYPQPLRGDRMREVFRRRIGVRHPALETLRDAFFAGWLNLIGTAPTGPVSLAQIQGALLCIDGVRVNKQPQPYAMGVWHD